jgi:hypothetical protein
LYSAFSSTKSEIKRISGYHHARLVMNRHLFGVPYGLPLENLNRHYVEFSTRGNRPWTQNWSAKIVDDELFLRNIHVYSCLDSENSGIGNTTNHQFHFICQHILTGIPPQYKSPTNQHICEEIPELIDHRACQLNSCRDVSRSCIGCLTDYQITIKRLEKNEFAIRNIAKTPSVGPYNNGKLAYWSDEAKTHKPPHAAGWEITIVSYHQLGACRSPEDWKWKTMVSFAGLLIAQRDPVCYPPGSVMRKWQKTV